MSDPAGPLDRDVYSAGWSLSEENVIAEKTLVDRKKSVIIVTSVVNLHAKEVATRLTELFSPVLTAGEQLPDWQLDQELKVRLIQLRWQALADASTALDLKRRQLKRLRRALDKATEVVYSQLLSLKRILSGIRPRKSTQERWLKGRLSRDYTEVLHGAGLAQLCLLKMKKEENDWGATFDPESWRDAVESESKVLEEALEKDALARREVESLECDRRQRLEEFGNAFVCIAGELESIYKLAGMESVARLLKPSKKYPGRTLAEIRRLGKAGGQKKQRE